MARSFKRLKQVLNLEVQQGYQNKAVVGGIRQFVNFWVERARDEAVDEADKALVEQIAEVLTEYGRLPGHEARTKAIDSLMESLQRREDRLGPVSAPPRQKSALPRKENAQAKGKPQDKAADKRETAVSPKQKQQKPEEAPIKTTLPQVDPDPDGLAQPLTVIKGVGPKIANLIEKLGPSNIWELLGLYPRRYDDYTLMKPIYQLKYGDQVTVIGTIWETRARQTRNNQVIVQSIISDGTAKIQASWFNQRWLLDKLPAGMQIVLSGTVDQYLGRLVFNSPEWEPLEIDPLKTRRIVPIYPLTHGLNSNKLRDIMRKTVHYWAPRVPETLPEELRQRQDLFNLQDALYHIHFPDTQEALHKAQRRIVFDELFLLQLGMQSQRQDWQSQPSHPSEPQCGGTRSLPQCAAI